MCFWKEALFIERQCRFQMRKSESRCVLRVLRRDERSGMKVWRATRRAKTRSDLPKGQERIKEKRKESDKRAFSPTS